MPDMHWQTKANMSGLSLALPDLLRNALYNPASQLELVELAMMELRGA
jgi:hypothetical protein